jgi:hypothetical protein
MRRSYDIVRRHLRPVRRIGMKLSHNTVSQYLAELRKLNKGRKIGSTGGRRFRPTITNQGSYFRRSCGAIGNLASG